QYARLFPEATRSLVLDGVVPNSMVLGQEHARNLGQALDAQFARCRAEPSCVGNLGDPARKRVEVRATRQTGMLEPVSYRDPTSGEWLEDQPTFAHLAVLLRMFSYQPGAAATLPLLLHEAGEGRYAPLMAQARMLTGSIGDQMSHGMQLSVICTEDASEMKIEAGDDGSVLGNDMVTLFQAQCAE